MIVLVFLTHGLGKFDSRSGNDRRECVCFSSTCSLAGDFCHGDINRNIVRVGHLARVGLNERLKAVLGEPFVVPLRCHNSERRAMSQGGRKECGFSKGR